MQRETNVNKRKRDASRSASNNRGRRQQKMCTIQHQDDEMEVDTEVQFNDGDQMLDMRVNTAENDEFPGESELSDNEVEIEEVNQRGSKQNEDSNERSYVEEEPGVSHDCRNRSRSRSRSVENSLQDQISKIDHEMSVKLAELHKLMEQEGMDESVEMVSKCASLLKKKQTKCDWEGKELNELNQNRNAYNLPRAKTRTENNDKNSMMTSKSMETIYQCAVPRRTSSSSEEDLGLNSSDEFKGDENWKHKNIVENINSLITDLRRDTSDRRSRSPRRSAPLNG